ncbi:MAG: histidine kinase N-terminal 7TM domain-containing protein [Anaerolineales bacterium]
MFQYTPVAIPLIISIIVSIVVIITAFGRRHIPGVRAFIWLMLCVIEWTFFYMLEILTPDPQAKIIWQKCYYIGVVLAPLAWLIFSLEYSRMTSLLTRRNLLLLAILPAVIILLIWTNDYHHIIWTGADYARNWGFWVHAGYCYIFFLIGSFLLVRQALKGPAAFESQAAMMILGASFALVANVLYIFGLTPFLKLDPTPFAMMVSGVFYAWGLFRLGLFDLLPVAGEVVLEGLQDGVMVLDRAGRVVYVNPAFVDYSGISEKDAIGANAQTMLARWPDLVEEFRDTMEANTQISAQFAENDTRRFELRISPLLDYGRRQLGRVFILRLISSPIGARELDLTSATVRRKLMLMTMLANGEVVAVNDHFLGTMGYTRPEIIEKPAIKIWQSAEQRSTLLRKTHNEGFEDMEIGLIAKNGQVVNLVASAKSVTINGETYLFFAMREKR